MNEHPNKYATPREQYERALESLLADRNVDLKSYGPDDRIFVALIAIHAERLSRLAELESHRFDPVAPNELKLARDLIEEWWLLLDEGDLDGQTWLGRLAPVFAEANPRNSLYDRLLQLFHEQLRAQCSIGESWRRAIAEFLSLTSSIGYELEPSKIPDTYPEQSELIGLIAEDVVTAIDKNNSAARSWSQESANEMSRIFREIEGEPNE